MVQEVCRTIFDLTAVVRLLITDLSQSATVSLSEMFNHGFFMILGLFMFWGLFMFLQFVFRICKINKQEHNNYPPR